MSGSSRAAFVSAAFHVTLLFTLASCNRGSGNTPTVYVPPDTGTVFRYTGGIVNRVTAVDGMRVEFVDQTGRVGRRTSWFITEYPGEVTQIDTAALASLWPLQVGKEVVVGVKRGDEVWRWELRVTGRETITVPAGQFDSFQIQAVEAPEEVRDPARAYTAVYRFWYSKDVDAVVKFQTTYVSGPAQGRTGGAELNRVVYPGTEPADTLALR